MDGWSVNRFLMTVTITLLSCHLVQAQNYDRYKPPTLPPAGPTPSPNIEESLPPVAGSDKILLESLDAVVVFDDGEKVSATDDRPDAEGLLYNYPDESSLVYSARFQQIVNSYIGQPVSLRSINQLSRDIIELYRRNQQPILDVLVPEQKITGGTLQIVVIETCIGSVMYRGIEYSKPDALDRWLHSSYPGNRIYEPWLEDELFWLNQNRFRRVTVDLQPGLTEGTTDIFFDVDEVFPLRGYMGYDDTGVEQLGIERFVAGFIYGNLFGYDGTLSYQYTADAEFARLNAHALTYSQPVNWDWSWSTYGSWSEVKPIVDLFDQNGESWMAGGYLRHHLRKTRTIDESAKIGFEFKSTNNSVEFGGVNISNSNAELAQMFLGYEYYEYQECDQYTRLNADTWIGLGPGFSPGNTAEAFNSVRLDTDPSYIYARARLENASNFGPNDQLQLVSRMSGQISSERLLFSETLGFGGFDTIRGYDQRIINGDHGWQASFELGPRTQNLCIHGRKSRLRPYVFTDLGQAFIQDPQPFEFDNQFLASVGAGCQFAIGQNFTFRFDYGHALEDVDFQRTKDRVHIGLIWLFGPELD